MEEKLIKQLKELYINIDYSTTATDFYDRVYKYLKLLNESKVFKLLIANDRKRNLLHYRQKKESIPLNFPHENWKEIFVKERNHMESGNRQFISYYFDVLNRDIYQYFFDQYQYQQTSDQFIIMRSGTYKREVSPRLPGFDSKLELKRLNKLYVDWYPHWRVFIEEFHKLVLETLCSKPVVSEVKTLHFLLEDNGHFVYQEKEGNITVSSKEFRLLKMLYDKKNGVVLYKDIIKNIYNKEDNSSSRMDINIIIRDIRKELFILPTSKTSLKNIIKNHRNLGYSLNLKDIK